LREVNVDIKKAKDAIEVAEIEIKSLPEWDRFEKLVSNAGKTVSNLPTVCRRALYDKVCGRNLEWPKGLGNEDETERIKTAIDNSLLVDEEEQGVSVNEEEPKIARAIDALNELERFLNKTKTEFWETYVEKFDHQPKITSRQFWDEHIG
jgi:hypothetical protein